MRIKSYFASSVEQAVQEARQELGAEAALITSRRTPPESRHLGNYEVVFGIAQPAADPNAALASGDLSAELGSLREQLDGIKRLLKLSAPGDRCYARPELSTLHARLVGCGLEERFAQQIVDETSPQWMALPVNDRPGSALYGLAANNVVKRLRFSTSLTPDSTQTNRLVILTGPPGAGKTTTLVKIAVQCLARRLSLRIISLDLHRVAAHEKLRAYAAVLGAGFTVANTAHEFTEAIEEFREKNVVLIDTPGYGNRDQEWVHRLAGLLSELKQREVHLVLPASMKLVDLLTIISLYQPVTPDFALFTKLDETTTYGTIVSAALDVAKPISFLTSGQNIPEDLSLAAPEFFLASLFGHDRATQTTAA